MWGVETALYCHPPLYTKLSKQEACPLVRSKGIQSIFIYTFMLYFNSSVPRQSLTNSFTPPVVSLGTFISSLHCLRWMKWERQKQRTKKSNSINKRDAEAADRVEDQGTIHCVDMMGYRTTTWEDPRVLKFIYLLEYTTVYRILHWKLGDYKNSKYNGHVLPAVLAFWCKHNEV